MRVPPCSADASYAALVVDDDSAAVRRLCSTTEPAAGELGALRCSGSAQPSVAAFGDLRRRLPGVRDDDLIVVDLRHESHGFVDGAAVSWYAESNWGTAGLAEAEALALERLRLRLLAEAPVIRVGTADAVKHGRPAMFAAWQPQRVQPEAEAFGLAGERHVRFPVIDHCAPSDDVVDRFVALVRGRSATAHLHLHCRGGKGRTATFLALVDLLHHAAHLPLDAILDRQARWTGYDLRKPADPASRKAPFLAARRALIAQFHDYARTGPLDSGARWTDWIAR